MNLSKRLKAIKELVLADTILADIGCDHAYLSCACVQEGICVKAYACDVNAGPLQHATKTIEDFGLSEKVLPILTNGLHDVPSDTEVVVISGMGFETMKMILENDLERLSAFKQLILQTNCDVNELRAWLSDHDFQICAEVLVFEGHYYQIIAVTPNGQQKLSASQIEFGVYLNQDPLFRDYFTLQRQKANQILEQLSEDHPKYIEIKHQIERIDEQLKNEF